MFHRVTACMYVMVAICGVRTARATEYETLLPTYEYRSLKGAFTLIKKKVFFSFSHVLVPPPIAKVEKRESVGKAETSALGMSGANQGQGAAAGGPRALAQN